MWVLTADEIRALCTPSRLVEALREAFRTEHVTPVRQVVRVPGAREERLFIAMPAFDVRGAGAVKLATAFPDNPSKGLPRIQAAIVVFSENGTPVALLDGTAVTYLRTGAASALASTYLSRIDSAHLVIIGTGPLAPYMASAHAAVRPIHRISVCGRRKESAAATASAIRSMVSSHVKVVVADSTEAAVATADVVSCATNSVTPVLEGKWLRSGVFVDLVGSFSPNKREADDDVVLRSRIFVDTFDGALAEAGDILDPLGRGVITRDRIEGELADLANGRVNGRSSNDEIVTFKSVGTAIEDFAAAQMIIAEASQRNTRGR